MANEKTVSQILVGAGPDSAYAPPRTLILGTTQTGAWRRKVRQMRRDATLSYLRKMFAAPILAAEWSVVSDDKKFEDAVEMVKQSTVPHRVAFLESATRGLLDFGWQPFEIVKGQQEDGTFYVEKYKPLLQDLTDIIVDYYGNLVGVKNTATFSFVRQDPVILMRGDCVVLSNDVEGTDWYGQAVMRACERSYDSWNESDDAARRFDNKIAGAHWKIRFPIGVSEYNGQKNVDNFEIAKQIGRDLSSSGLMIVPSTVLKSVDDLNGLQPLSQFAWDVELITSPTQQGVFVDRGRYLDSLKARGIGLPERSVMEGQFGTKAEAEAHTDFAIENIEMFHRNAVSILNKQAVNPLLELNKGPAYKDKVRVQAAPLSDAKKAFFRQLYTTLMLGTEVGQATELDTVDISAIREALGIPVTDTPGQGSAQRRILQQQASMQQNGQGGQGGQDEEKQGELRVPANRLNGAAPSTNGAPKEGR